MQNNGAACGSASAKVMPVAAVKIFCHPEMTESQAKICKNMVPLRAQTCRGTTLPCFCNSGNNKNPFVWPVANSNKLCDWVCKLLDSCSFQLHVREGDQLSLTVKSDSFVGHSPCVSPKLEPWTELSF